MLTLNEILIGLAFSLPFLLLPIFIALWRGHPYKVRLALLNILGLPLFGIGWVLALIWAVTVPESAGTEAQRRPEPKNIR